MSVTGRPQEFSTVKSSWEELDSPVPLRSKSSQHPFVPQTKSLISESKTITSLRAESSGYSTEQTLTSSGHQVTEETVITQSSSKETHSKSETHNNEIDFYSERPNTDNSILQESSGKLDGQRGTATYVSSQRRPTEDIAESILTEFEQHARKAHQSNKKPFNIVETANLRYLQDHIGKEESKTHSFQNLAHEETDLSNASEENNPQSGFSTRSLEKFTPNIKETRSPESQRYSEMSRETSSYAYQGHISHTSPLYHHSENSDMSQMAVEKKRHGVNTRNASERARYVNSQNERPADIRNMNNQQHCGDQTLPPLESRDNLPTITNSQSSSRYRDNLPIQNGHLNNGMHKDGDRQTLSPRVNSNVPDATRSLPEVVNHPHVPANMEENPSVSRQTMLLQNMQLPIFHPPPTIIQNGITQADLVELMSKGLGQFTTEMAVMVLEKLKPEYEALAKQVGAEVKETTVTELKDLREKLAAAEADVESLKVERDKLKSENSKERDQMKKEFEKDRLKRVKEFEEKKELIDTLQKENDQLKSILKEKDRILKKSEAKAKAEEQKRLKSEEEAGLKHKELQKELDKVKGELLVQKSKKRLQVTSASKKECLGKLNSQHGLHPRQFNGHKPIQYDEGDD